MTTIRVRARWLLWGVVAMSAAACGQGAQDGPESAALPGPEEPGQLATPAASLPTVSDEASFDLDEVVARAKLSFRTDTTGGYLTHQPTHTVQAKDGLVTFTPSTWDADAGKMINGAAVEIETVAITRDEGDLSLGLGSTQPDFGAQLRIDRGVAEERIQNSPAGIEQTWTFQHAPAGSGPLVVRVAIRGQRYLGVDARGHHFLDETSRVGLGYSHATWVDLTGQRTAVPVVFDGETGELVMAVPAEVLASSAYPAVLDPTVFAENGTTGPAITSSAGVEEAPAVAFDGTRYLVVWSDARDGNSFDIWGTFVSTAQVVQNTSGLLFSGANGDQRSPSIAFNGTNYLITWEDHRRSTSTVVNTDIMGQIVDTNGALVGGEISISLTGVAGHPDVARLGTNWMVVWEDFVAAGASNVLFAQVAANGTPSDPLALNDDPSTESRPAVACSTAACMAIFVSGPVGNEDIFRQRFDAAGLIDTVSSTISGYHLGRSLLPDVAFDGTNYLAVWQDRRTGTTGIYAQRVVASSGAHLDGDGFLISGAGIIDRFGPSVAYDGTQYLVAWQDNRAVGTRNSDIFGTRVQIDGTNSHPAGIAINAQPQLQRNPRVAAGGGQFFVVWEDERLGPPQNIRGTRITATGGTPDANGTPIATAANRQSAAAIAHAGAASNNYLLVYNDTRLNGAANYDLVAIRIAPAGTALDPGGFGLSTAAGNQIGPEIASNGVNFLVVWQDGRLGTTNYDVYGAVLTAGNAGIVVSTAANGYPISTAANNQLAPTVAWNAGANRWLVTWGDQRTTTNTDIYGARLEANGAVVDANGFLINAGPDLQTRPDVASNGADWLVAWTDRSSGVVNSENILGSIVTAGGVPGAAFSISTAANRQEAARVVYSGTSYVATWQDNRQTQLNYNILAARINAAGVVQDINGISIANSLTLAELRPRVLRMGANLFFVWSQQSASGSNSYDLQGRQYTAALTPVAASFTISNLSGSESQPAIAADTSNLSAIVAYQRYDSTLGIRAERVRYRRVSFP